MKFKRRVDEVLYRMAYDFIIETGGTEEEAHAEGLAKIERTYRLAEETKDEKYIDITTGKQVAYEGW